MSARGRLLRRPTRAGAAVLVGAAVLLTAGCGTSGSGASAGGAVSGDLATGAPNGPGTASEVNAQSARSGVGAAPSAMAGSGGAAQVQRRAVISAGHIALASPDLTATRQRLDAVLAREGGRIADENTTTNDHGTVTHSHLVVRVRSGRFDATMSRLSGVATLRAASRTANDVTTEVIDLKARISAERAGVHRLQRLVSQTASLRALLQVEQVLTQRQGELESLRRQRAYLHDLTSLATITVDVSLRTAPAPAAHAAGGFLGGLRHGWDALVAVVTAVLATVGAVIPFALAAAVLGLPTWLVLRRARRPRPPEAPAES